MTENGANGRASGTDLVVGAVAGADAVGELAERTTRGEAVKLLHFWGHKPRRDGTLGAGCFSQWWPAPFTVDGVEYATAEHWMMARKARLFGDEEAEHRAVTAANPALAKRAGRLVRGFEESVWERERYEIVVAGSVHKFGQDAALRTFLLATGERILVEASPMDRIWGIGLASDDERAHDPARWRGLNLLGFALMEARTRLRSGTAGTRAERAGAGETGAGRTGKG
ncbi:NADAR family protein [Streptomyces sp. NBC_01429]|uniref:NADAR family protein n=1 Tax=Streptomyces sp. NBC_01429 TaxID=2903862 RepID=UPI002E2D69D1|nr:NADAR family protein [Streptomyces sp. NBC_01429]